MTTQNVAWPTTIVSRPKSTPKRHERRSQRDAGHDARQRDREDQQERDRLPAEERVALDGERGERPEDQRDRGRDGRGEQRVDDASTTLGLPRASSNQCSVNPVGGQAWIRLGLNA